MFWRYNLITGSCIETLLDKENVTLKELMDEEDILQECKAQTKKLLDFLIQPEILDEMVSLITDEPEEEGDERIKYRYSNRACELLTFDIAQINDALASNEDVLNKLYYFLKTEKPLNPLLASFVSKTMGLLILKKTESIFNFLKDKDFITLALNHLDTSAIMDLFLRLATSIENNEMRNSVIKWLDEQKLIQQLVSRIDVDYDEEVNCNASYALCHIIKSSREHMSHLQEKADPNPLLETLESVEVVTSLLNHMFKDVSKESAIVNGVLVLLELLTFKKEGPAGIQQMPSNQSDSLLQAENAPYTTLLKSTESEQMTALDAERLSHGVNNVLKAVTPRLDDFHNLLLKPPIKPPITLTIGRLDPPLGCCRLEVAHLLTALLSTNNHDVNVKLASLETIIVLLDMFFDYSWNNFLHSHVEDAIFIIVTNSPTGDNESNKYHPLLDQILMQYKITIKIIEKFEEKPVKSGKKGFMGHLTEIANRIAENLEGSTNSPLIKEKLKDLPKDHQKHWEKFVNETLAEINKKNTVPQAPSGPSLSTSSIDKDSPFGKNASIHLGISDYHMQEMTSNFIDQFGFNDDEFGDADDSLIYARNALNPLSQNFSLGDSNNIRSAELFEEVCQGKISSDGEGVLWGDKDTSPTFSTCFRMSSKPTDDNSSDSDDECQVFESENAQIGLPSDEMKMDVDNHDGMFDGVPMDVVPAALHNPWEATESNISTSDEQGNWADFSNFAAFGASTSENSAAMGSTVSMAMETSDSSSFIKCASGSESISESNSLSDVSKKDHPEGKSSEKQTVLTGLFDEETCSASVHNGPV